MIHYADDNDQLPDTSGSRGYTGASLTKPDMPRDFTICLAYMNEAYTTDWDSADLIRLHDRDGDYWGSFELFAALTYTELTVRIGKGNMLATTADILFPFTWSRFCVSFDTVTARMAVVLNGQVVEEGVRPEIWEEDEWRPTTLDLVFGYSPAGEDTGMTSQLNIFSSALSTARMVALTSAGGDECGTPGDYVSWEEEDWKLTGLARREMVEEQFEGPCRRESGVTVYTAEFEELEACMNHCEKLGQGRSPPIRTLAEWDWLRTEVHAITRDISVLPYLWLAVTDEEVEAEWRDSYTGDKLQTNVSWPWYYEAKDTILGNGDNCIFWYTDESDESSWKEWLCHDSPQACACQYKTTPDLLLRGLCPDNSLDRKFTVKQLPGSPNNLMIVGQTASRIQYNDSSALWVMTDLVYSVRAESIAPKVSYALGKHEWTVTGDVFDCHGGQPYTTTLKLSGCIEGQFTCDDGQCVTMEERCNQIPNCRDESDEVDCRLLVLKSSYNKKVPPIVPTGGNNFNQAEVGISISLLKIVSMEEVQHKIDLQFEITLEWKENRAKYQNLKEKTSLNALTNYEIENIWLPYVIYANTDMKEAVQLYMEGVDTTIVVNRQGNFTRSDNKIIEEIEVFEGKENRLLMYQSYTKSFQCLYKLQKYPFDKQVEEDIN